MSNQSSWFCHVKAWPSRLQYPSNPAEIVWWDTRADLPAKIWVKGLSLTRKVVLTRRLLRSLRLIANLGSRHPNSLLLVQPLPSGDVWRCEPLCCCCSTQPALRCIPRDRMGTSGGKRGENTDNSFFQITVPVPVGYTACHSKGGTEKLPSWFSNALW